jgi:integrase
MIRETKSGRFEVDVWIWDMRLQRKRRIQKTFDHRRKAERFERDSKTESENGGFIDSKKLPRFSDVCEDWLAGKRTHAAGSVLYWRIHLDKYLIPILGAVRIDRINVAAAEALRDRIHAGGLAPKTVNKVLTTGAAVFDFAMRRQFVKLNPFELAERLRQNPADLSEDDAVITEEDIYPTKELRRLLDAEHSRKYRVLFLVGALLGPRHSEILALQWQDLILDAETPYARIRRTLTNAKDPRLSGEQPRFSFKTPKTRSGIRDVKLPPELLLELRLWKAECPESPYGLVFPNQAGEPMRRETVLDHLHATQTKAGIPIRDIKALRHTAASSMIAAGKPDTEVAYALGHKDAHVTRTVYAHWYRNEKSEGAGALAKQLLGPQTPPPRADGDILETSAAQEGYLH